MYHIYQVGNNDNLESIANKFNTNVNRIKELNGITGNVFLRPGGFVIVPKANDDSYFYNYSVKKGDTIYSLAKNNETDSEILLEINGLEKDDYIYPEQEILIPKQGVKLYKVKKGDSIDSIQQKLGVEFNKLETPNGEIYLEEDQIMMYR